MTFEINQNTWWPLLTGVELNARSDGKVVEYNPPGLNRLCRSWAYQKAVFEHSTEKEVDDGFFSPSFKVVHTDWPKVEESTTKLTAARYSLILKAGSKSPESAINTAIETRRWAFKYAARNRALDQSVTKRSLAELETKIAAAEAGKIVATLVRDASAEFILIAATGGTITGAAKIAAIGSGVLLKGAYKYQDTGHLGIAAIEASTELALAAFPMDEITSSFGNTGKFLIGNCSPPSPH